MRLWPDRFRLERAERGNYADPLKAALDVLRDTRWVVREVSDFGGLTPRSHRDGFLAAFAPRSALLAAGPPRIRLRQAMALRAAGILRDARFGRDAERGRFVRNPERHGRAGTCPADYPIWYEYQPGGLVKVITAPGVRKARLMLDQ